MNYSWLHFKSWLWLINILQLGCHHSTISKKIWLSRLRLMLRPNFCNLNQLILMLSTIWSWFQLSRHITTNSRLFVLSTCAELQCWDGVTTALDKTSGCSQTTWHHFCDKLCILSHSRLPPLHHLSIIGNLTQYTETIFETQIFSSQIN